jgi:hypothetical protein
VDPSEGFVLTWQERVGTQAALQFAVLDRDGRELRRGRVAQGSGWFVNWADFPSLAVLENGDWVTHWLAKAARSTYAYDIKLVRSRDRGRTWSEPITPHTDRTETQHGFVSLVPQANDQVLVVWLDGRRGAAVAGPDGHKHDHAGSDDEPMTLRSALLDRAGRRSEEIELDRSTCSCCQTDAARIGAKSLVVYRDRSAANVRDISMIDRLPQGRWTEPARVHADGWRIEGCPVNGPALAVNGADWLVVWPTGARGPTEIRYAIQSGAEPMGSPVELAPGRKSLGRLDAAPWQRGYLISWVGDGRTGSGLLLRAVDERGRELAERVVASLPMGRVSGNPRLATNGDRGLIAWVEPGANGGYEIGLALIRATAGAPSISR